jgi:hypothetical protein
VSESEIEVDYESEARRQGWVPEEEWRGDEKPKEFVDAQTFVERGKVFEERQKSENAALRSEIAEIKKTNREFKETQDRILQQEREAHKARIEQLEADREQAITEGDGAAFTKVDREINELREEEPVDPGKLEHDRMAQAWLDQNEWYTTNKKLHRYADGVAEELQREGYVGQAYFNELARRVREDMPAEFESPKGPPAVEPGRGSGVSEPKPQSFEALDKASKSAFDRFFNAGYYGDNREKAQAEYLANYDWDQEDE